MSPLEKLWPEAEADDPRHEVTVRWMPAEDARSACLVLPGGAYRSHADHEAETIGTWLNQQAISAAVLRYRVAPRRHPEPLEDAAEAMRQARLRFDSLPVGVIGSSAGGHLAATLSVHFEQTEHGALARPDFAVLCYPVIHLETAAAHLGSRRNLLADNETPELLRHLSCEQHVTPQTPPTFLWHTTQDTVVRPVHSLMYATALAEQNVPCELHLYERGRHGLGLSLGPDDPPEVSDWAQRCVIWLNRHGWAR